MTVLEYLQSLDMETRVAVVGCADDKRCTRCAAAFLRRKMHGRRHGYGR